LRSGGRRKDVDAKSNCCCDEDEYPQSIHKRLR
jgi:hypothetical protein